MGIGIAVAVALTYDAPLPRVDHGDTMAGWVVYDYRANTELNVFHPTVERGGAVWADDSLWSIDDPETPKSVLALVRYEKWDMDGGEHATTRTAGTDLRGRCVSFELRSDGLNRHGAEVSFWVMSSTTAQRWHTTALLEVVDGEWTRQEVPVSAVGWRRSWSDDPEGGMTLDETLAHANSYGVAFVGFGEEEPTGELGMRGFEITSC